MPSYRIRSIAEPGWANEEAMSAVRAIDTKLFAGCSNEFDTATHWWGVFCKNKLVGYAALRWFEKEKYVYLCRSGVVVEHRGHKLQRRLIEVRVRKGRKLGCRQAISYTMYDNLASINSLIAKGFRAYHPEYAWAGRTNVIYWSKPIA